MYSEATIQKLNEIAARYRDLIYRAVHDVISKEPYTNTGAAAASLTVEVIPGDAKQAPRFVIQFAEHLIYIDKRRLQWTKLPNIGKLTEWAETVKPDPKSAKRLAWAVAWKQRKYDTWKAKPWRRKSLSKVLKEMNALVLEAFDRVIEQDLQKATQV